MASRRKAPPVYRTYWALLDLDAPERILRLQDETPLLTPRADLTAPISALMYACRITRVPKSLFPSGRPPGRGTAR
ncbi:MAG TPA: hypothetical protein VG841_04035 [Caulobacterales bacterium]|nr:hypothetical protein [Caulobacterales bacterium]